ncbi:sigma-54-dependent transcriptional regulator [Oceaniradius stylonematis]|uniref:sigma-54-dependent transcriptional regulator n=1 Tax=Oceaniradius stylonematis TaxID=2184161 RepID=UPI00273EE2F6|nr:sigma-54 dependent transcriptional regulator [Oceaniradius stylonematis]
MTSTIVIVDDDPVQRRLAEAALTRDGLSVTTYGDGPSALDRLAGADAEPVDAMVLDLVMPDMDGIAVLKSLRERGADVPVIVQTAQGSIDVAISAMRAGAFDFLVKPVAPERLAKTVRDAVKVARTNLAPAETAARGRARLKPVPVELVGDGREMERVRRLIKKASSSDIPVLIEGESGTGKELVARAIAAKGPRAGRPLVIVNCGAIPDNLVESILFGHEKGAFTGATEKHTGKFVEADGGTLFLDEIGELPLAAQVKLLRAIQDGHVEPVGARAGRTVDVRLISATNRDLIAAVREGRFREDLYYRLNVFPILTPSLRARADDLPALVAHIAARQAHRAGRAQEPVITDAAMDVLRSYDWPGNVRQLENELFRAIVLSDSGTLDTADFAHITAQFDPVRQAAAPRQTAPNRLLVPAPNDAVPAAPDTGNGADRQWQPDTDPHRLPLLDADNHARALSDIEADVIAHALGHYDGQMSEIARRLGIGRSTLYRKLREYGIGEPRH